MPLICSKKQNCDRLYKDKILVFDSSSLFHILEAIATRIPMRLTEDQRFENFYYSLNRLFSKIRLCSCGAILNVTIQVFDEELNPTDPHSALRDYTPFVEVCANNDHKFSRIHKLFQEVFLPKNLNSLDDGILLLQQLVHTGPNQIYGIVSRNDFSLLLLSLELSPQKETLLVTDDSNLNKASENVCSKRYVTLPSGNVDTTRILSTSSLSYLEDLYSCCEVNNNDFWALVTILGRFIESLKASYNPSYEVRERELNQVTRTASSFNK